MKLSSRSRPGSAVQANRAEAVRRLLSAAPERVVCGSDWPHTPETGESGFRAVNDRAEARGMLELVGAEADRVFRANPERLFG